MKALAALVVSLGVFAAPAGAATPCESVVARFSLEHPQIIEDAYILDITCTSEPQMGRAGMYQAGHVTIYEGVAGLERTVAHEIGHAWQMTARAFDAPRGVGAYAEFGAIRGFSAGTPDEALKEDYAEVFAYSLGDAWFTVPAGTPMASGYDFQNAAGAPTNAQLLALFYAGLLPEFPWRTAGAFVL